MSVSKKHPRYPGRVPVASGAEATHVEWMARTLEWERMLSRLRARQSVSGPRRGGV